MNILIKLTKMHLRILFLDHFLKSNRNIIQILYTLVSGVVVIK